MHFHTFTHSNKRNTLFLRIMVYYTPLLLRGRLHLVRDISAEKEFDIAIYLDDTGAR